MNSASAWKLERDAEGIAWLTLDKPGTSTNVLGHAILEQLGTLAASEEDARQQAAANALTENQIAYLKAEKGS